MHSTATNVDQGPAATKDTLFNDVDPISCLSNPRICSR